MRDAPILQRLGGGPAALREVVENFNGGGDMGGGNHRRVALLALGGHNSVANAVLLSERRARARPEKHGNNICGAFI